MRALACIGALFVTLTPYAAYADQARSQQDEDDAHKKRYSVLRLACLEEARWSADQKKRPRFYRHHFNQYLNSAEQIRRLKALCREMTTFLFAKGVTYDHQIIASELFIYNQPYCMGGDKHRIGQPGVPTYLPCRMESTQIARQMYA